MTYIVTEPCIGTKDRACVEVCPVECFYEGTDQLYIHPHHWERVSACRSCFADLGDGGETFCSGQERRAGVDRSHLAS